MSADLIIKKSIALYNGQHGVSLLQFLLLVSYVGIGAMLVMAIHTIAFPDVLITELFELNLYNIADEDIKFSLIVFAVIFIMYFVAVPYIYGGVWYSENAVTVKAVPSAALFGCYNYIDRVIKALRLECLLILYKLPVFLAVSAVIFIDAVLTINIMSFTEGLMPVFAAGGCALSVFGVFVLYKVYALRYFPVRHLFAENPDLSPFYILRTAKALTSGKTNLLADLYLRLLPLYVLSLAILPALAVLPLANGAYSYFYQTLRAGN
jgi:hypothetical protein